MLPDRLTHPEDFGKLNKAIVPESFGQFYLAPWKKVIMFRNNTVVNKAFNREFYPDEPMTHEDPATVLEVPGWLISQVGFLLFKNELSLIRFL